MLEDSEVGRTRAQFGIEGEMRGSLSGLRTEASAQPMLATAPD
jgi:hypothetical protein